MVEGSVEHAILLEPHQPHITVTSSSLLGLQGPWVWTLVMLYITPDVIRGESETERGEGDERQMEKYREAQRLTKEFTWDRCIWGDKLSI